MAELPSSSITRQSGASSFRPWIEPHSHMGDRFALLMEVLFYVNVRNVS